MTEAIAPSCIVIPAAGRGVRFSQGPKALAKVSERDTVLARLVRQLRERWPETPIYVGVGYCGDKVMEQPLPNVHYVLCKEYETTNVAETVRLLLKQAPNGSCLICLGDLVFADSVIHSLHLISPGVLWGECGLLRLGEVGLTVSNDRTIGHLTHDLPIRWAQLAYLDFMERQHLESILGASATKRCFLYEIMNRVLVKVPLFFDSINGWMVEIDVSRDLALAKLAVKMDMGELDAILD